MGESALINKKDVITMRIPFPDISSTLAVKSHMYICHEKRKKDSHFVKCQTLKPAMLIRSPIKHFWDEKPDLSRNPFKNTTRIDCDKDFNIKNVIFDMKMRTVSRPDVCDDVLNNIISELNADGYVIQYLDENDIRLLNPLVS